MSDEHDRHHYLYQITDTETGEYYIGMRSSKEEREDDKYFGSGRWPRKLHKKYGRCLQNAPNKKFTREILEYCGSRDEAFYRERVVIGQRWLTDPLCMNKSKGGLGGISGLDNPLYRDDKRDFFSLEDSESFSANRMELQLKYGLTPTQASNLFVGRTINHRGVILKENLRFEWKRVGERKWRICNSEKKQFHSHITGISFFASRLELIEQHGLTQGEANNLFSNRQRSHRGVVLYENKDIGFNISNNTVTTLSKPETEHFYSHITQTSFNATRDMLVKDYGLKSQYASDLFLGKRIYAKGIVLYKNKHIEYSSNRRTGTHEPRYNPELLHFYCNATNTDFYATRLDLREKYKLSQNNIQSLVSYKNVLRNGLVLFDCRHKEWKNLDEKKYFFSHISKEAFYASRKDLYNHHGISKKMASMLFIESTPIAKGIVLYKNKDVPLSIATIKKHGLNTI